jgi:4-amino-4-deoxy-L-arabinose transferase-like glycosyltransferase
LGVSDFAAKFPSALSALLIILLVFFLAQELSGEFLPSICASWIMMLSQHFMKWAMHAMSDAPFTLFFTLSIYLYIKGLKRPNYLILCGPTIGAAILTRSVIGFIPIGIIIGHLVVSRQFQRRLAIRLMGGLLIALLLSAIWVFSQYWSHGFHFLSAHFSFVSGKIAPGGKLEAQGVALGLLTYPWLLLKFYWPWAPLMIIGLVIQIRLAIRYRESSAVLLAGWVLLVVGLFSLAQMKVLRYIMPAFPAFSILAAVPVARLVSAMRGMAYLRTAYAVLIAVVFLIGCFPNPMMRAEDMIKVAAAVNSRVSPSHRVIIYTSNWDQLDYVPQFLWYSNRFCDHLTDPDKLFEALNSQPGTVFIMDAGDYEKLTINARVYGEVIAATRNLVCFKTVPLPIAWRRNGVFPKTDSRSLPYLSRRDSSAPSPLLFF